MAHVTDCFSSSPTESRNLAPASIAFARISLKGGPPILAGRVHVHGLAALPANGIERGARVIGDGGEVLPDRDPSSGGAGPTGRRPGRASAEILALLTATAALAALWSEIIIATPSSE
ncbi:hypothetical protein FZ983_28150 [Azospirillum sp. B21]|uniref:hypothetical protein n=1 Tax=Azospirillum sp. B21 TaxID=2607496 RepID=UPI0011EBF0FF|nr:hypothetical protein [Azospirillum sp. B21]KAA0574404.1 hypothetical protein FZ983_28150 [Azospirillum sp. B21]